MAVTLLTLSLLSRLYGELRFVLSRRHILYSSVGHRLLNYWHLGLRSFLVFKNFWYSAVLHSCTNGGENNYSVASFLAFGVV